MRYAPTLLSALLVLAACKKDPVDPVDLGYRYFPVQVGHWVEYEVDSVWYDQFVNVSGTRSYRLRELLLEDFTDAAGRTAQRIHRFVQDSTGGWRIRDVWWQVRDNYAAERTEEDQRRLKLSFPVRNDRTWNVNNYNPGRVTTVRYKNVDASATLNGLFFDSTATVLGTYPNNLVDTLIYEERYAKRVGLVYKYQVESNTQFVGGMYRTRGWKLRMQAVAFGQE
ncbi:MAG: hypothetical protein JNM31_05415 [Flavobacteriales bacterium]|nr:hypothetical protein [Flavobacteriales bacterium]